MNKPTPRKSGFQKGKSGNPKGRPKGDLGLAAMFLKQKLMEKGEAVINVIIEKALSGDMAASKLVIDRIIPACKDMHLKVDLPTMLTLKDVDLATDKLIEYVSNSELTPSEGHSIAGFIENKRKVMESRDLEKRIEELEKMAKD